MNSTLSIKNTTAIGEWLRVRFAILAIIVVSITTLIGLLFYASNQQGFNWLIYSILAVIIILQLIFIIFLKNWAHGVVSAERLRAKKIVERNQLLLENESGLVHSERDSGVATLVSCISHEMNTPLGFIKSSLEFLQDSLQELQVLLAEKKVDQQQMRMLFDDIDEAGSDAIDGVNRVADIVKSLKDFSRVDRAEWDDIDIVQCFESTLLVCKHSFPANVKLVKTYKGAPMVSCSATQISQVFLNLLKNALDALAGEGQIEVKIFSDKQYVNIFIEDNGVGIPAEQLDKIFDPYHTTKTHDKGTGLGLYISKRIVENHQGELLVESHEAKGTIFAVRLPVLEK